MLRDLIAGATNASLASASFRMALLLCGVGPSTSLSQGSRQRGIGAALVSGDLVAQRGPLLDQEVHSCDDDRQSN